MLISRSSCWNLLSKSGKVLKGVFVSKRQKKGPEKSRPPALSCWYWSPVTISAGFKLFCIYSRSERESSDPSSPALTMTKSSLSTVCWTSRALARFPLACTQHPKLKPPHLWMMGAALMWKTQQKVKVCYFSLQATPPTPPPSFIFLYSATCQMSEQDVLHFICWNRLLFPLTAHSWTEAQAHLLSSGLGAFPVPVVGLVLTTCC